MFHSDFVRGVLGWEIARVALNKGYKGRGPRMDTRLVFLETLWVSP